MRLTFGYSPCPNDTFAFHALAARARRDARSRSSRCSLDIEELNRRAHRGELDLTKLSFGAAARGRRAVPAAAQRRGPRPRLRAAGGRARSRSTLRPTGRSAGRLAVPGRETTAYLLLRLAAPELGDVVELRYDEILGAVERGEVDAGLIIHESRFTYRDHGLVEIADLGAWWEAETGLPIPLAGICARSDLDDAVAAEAERAIRASVEHAFAHPEDSREYVRAHAQELSDEVCRSHIELYVNAYSVDLGDDGLEAIAALTGRASLVR